MKNRKLGVEKLEEMIYNKHTYGYIIINPEK